MAIKKQEFYEGAALHQLIRGSPGTHVVYAAPFFVFDARLQVHIKYSTAKRSPWAFTFTPEEQTLLREHVPRLPLVIGLVCGADGVAALPLAGFESVARLRDTALHLSCYRKHREHFEINGPDGTVVGKVPPSDWTRLLKKFKEGIA